MTWPLLHNMSSRPTAVLTHESPLQRDDLVVFELAGVTRATRPDSLLSALDGKMFRGSAAAADAALRQRINDCARKLKWPPVALAVDQATDKARYCADLLMILTALSKTGTRVYLRDKEPNIASLGSRRRVVLRLPPSWVSPYDR